MGNQSNEILWPEKIKNTFEFVVSHIPEEIRSFAHNIIFNAISENVKARGGMEVTEEDIVNAFLQNTPPFFKDNMIKGLKETCVDLKKYNI